MKTRPIPIRLEEETCRRLQRAARKMGICRASVMKLAIVTQLTQIEAGMIRLNMEPLAEATA